ncbi:THO complex subunit 3 [Bienertia sinuspersici]
MGSSGCGSGTLARVGVVGESGNSGISQRHGVGCGCVMVHGNDLVGVLGGGVVLSGEGGKCSQQAELSGENINITYKPDGAHIAVGNRDDELTILDVRKFKPIHRRKFNYEVSSIELTAGSMCFCHDSLDF